MSLHLYARSEHSHMSTIGHRDLSMVINSMSVTNISRGKSENSRQSCDQASSQMAGEGCT